MVGGGSNPSPGEVSLAHLGVLFLDEMPEFPRSVLEGLRQPMEDGLVNIIRANAHVQYPASFTLLAAINPCPCGYLGHPKRACLCTDKQIHRYRSRISGPILDRIDLHIQVPAVDIDKLTLKNSPLPTSKDIRFQIIGARKIQSLRFSDQNIYTNSQMGNRLVKKFCPLTPESENLLRIAIDKLDLSARAYFRLIKVARTIADLDQSENILTNHLAESLQYRPIS
jgi:magnesium chelatase family protein